MKKLKYIVPALAFAFFSCEDYLDVNSPVDNPTGDQVTPNLSLSAAQTQTYRTLARTGNQFGNLFLNNWGYNVNAFAVTNPEEFSLSLTNNTYAGIWDGLYVNTANFTNIIEHPAANYENHKAIAKILKAFYFQYLVDLYGDIPYTEAHKGSNNLTPEYDDDQAIYRDLVVQIEDAINTIDNPVSATIQVGAEDVIFGGNMGAWKTFANTLKLRILLRQSEMTDGETTAYLAQEFSELQDATFLTTDATINPGYSNSNVEQMNPYYNLWRDINGEPTNFYRQFAASRYFVDNLNDASAPDPRRSRIFTLIGGNVVGVLQGDSSATNGGTAPNPISQFGPAATSSAAMDGYMMLAAESYLLQSEAALRGFIPGDAGALFNLGVAASFNQMAVAPGTYISSISGIPNKGFNVGFTQEQNLRAIMYQKNVALTHVNAMEVFIEYTRTGFIDEIPLAGTGVPNGQIPPRANRMRRLLYPNSEIVGNSANVPPLSLDAIFTQGPFWFVD
ncbi:SusD/RagB family nutrient-binding outer membrane lipoprotein [Flavobacterium selenitireducens]|uniref:SusD/RagB family nutrient-binding outer membrane lipoprotein n=1 Tax=Flavobacterium selenitireducens TaxID=2722704 RepID=UPI00168A6854|nr:SusD/RagB family nutrient-binding outer membrane lipoprotein [Flavobacterium selenitireducens]MBD3583392.1 SusD/RagB family nutrient-binding outer membrane lipoprotein [Flavobacterium selenitireducens]